MAIYLLTWIQLRIALFGAASLIHQYMQPCKWMSPSDRLTEMTLNVKATAGAELTKECLFVCVRLVLCSWMYLRVVH
jgi:hypothetical protein